MYTGLLVATAVAGTAVAYMVAELMKSDVGSG